MDFKSFQLAGIDGNFLDWILDFFRPLFKTEQLGNRLWQATAVVLKIPALLRMRIELGCPLGGPLYRRSNKIANF